MGTGREHVPFEISFCLQCAHAELKIEMVKDCPSHKLPGSPGNAEIPEQTMLPLIKLINAPTGAPFALNGSENKLCFTF